MEELDIGDRYLPFFFYLNIEVSSQVTDKKFIPKYVVPTVSKSQGVMVWAAINGTGNILVKRCPPTVKGHDYCDILADSISFIRPRYTSFPAKRPSECLVSGHQGSNFNKMEQAYTVHAKPRFGSEVTAFACSMKTTGPRILRI